MIMHIRQLAADVRRVLPLAAVAAWWQLVRRIVQPNRPVAGCAAVPANARLVSD